MNKPAIFIVGFIVLILFWSATSKNGTGAPKPEPEKKQPDLPLQAQQCVSCEDLAEVQAQLDELEKRVAANHEGIHARVDALPECKCEPVAQGAPVKLIPPTPVKKPLPAKSATKQPAATQGNCANGRCYAPGYNYRSRGLGRRR